MYTSQFIPSHKSHRVALVSCFLVPSARHQFTLPVGGYVEIVHCALCPFMPQLALILIAPTHGGMARLSWVAGYILR